MLENQGKKVTEDTEKANILNKYFISVLTEEPDILNSLPDVPDANPQHILEDFTITSDIVRKKLLRLKANRASGPDLISVNVLRYCPNFALPLTLIFNNSVQTGTLPQDWRDAHVSPIHKKGSRSKSGNYRPVSLTSQIVKLLERLFQDHLLKVINKNKTISCHQHGFQSRCSCVSQLLECLNDWTENHDNSTGTDVIYLDFAKAFDTVPHKRLIHKLRAYGIRGKVLIWVKNFLSNRRQKVVLRNGFSAWEDVISGVPQGSILGPILFLLYVNDIPSIVSSTAKMFADDTKLYCPIKTQEDCTNLQSDLNRLSVWSKEWLLKFNESKCVVLRIKKSLEYVYSLNGFPLQDVHHQKDLGVIISSNLLPQNHIQTIIKKSNQRIGLIKRCFTDITLDKVEILFNSIIRPILEYGSPSWNPWYLKDITNIENVQRRCFRLCHTPDLVLEPLAKRRLKADLCEVYKYLNDLYKTDKNLYFTQSQRTLRGNSLKLEKPYARTLIRSNFFYRVVNSWNSLPDAVVRAPSLDSFKEKLRSLPLGQEG